MNLAVSLLVVQSHAAAFNAVADDPAYATIDRLALHRLTFAALAAAAPVLSAGYRAEADAAIVQGIGVAADKIRPVVERALIEAAEQATAAERKRYAPLVAATRAWALQANVTLSPRGARVIEALAVLDATTRGPVDATEPLERVPESGDEGSGSDEDLRASQTVATVAPERFLGDALHDIATAGGPLRFRVTPLTVPIAPLTVPIKAHAAYATAAKRAADTTGHLDDRPERLRRNGKLRKRLRGSKARIKLLRAEVKRLGALVASLESVDPDRAEYDAAERAINDRWPSLADSERIAEIALDAAWYVFHRRRGAPDVDYRTTEQLHRDCAHPDWEYKTTTGQRKQWDDADTPPDGEGWERNVDYTSTGEGWERFDYHEESYWRRPKPDDVTPVDAPWGHAAVAGENWHPESDDAVSST